MSQLVSESELVIDNLFKRERASVNEYQRPLPDKNRLSVDRFAGPASCSFFNEPGISWACSPGRM